MSRHRHPADVVQTAGEARTKLLVTVVALMATVLMFVAAAAADLGWF